MLLKTKVKGFDKIRRGKKTKVTFCIYNRWGLRSFYKVLLKLHLKKYIYITYMEEEVYSLK